MDKSIKKSIRRKTIKKIAFEDPKGNLMWAILILLGLMGIFSFLVNLAFSEFGYSFDISFFNALITTLTMVLMAPISLGFMSMFLKNSRDQIYAVNDIFSEIKSSPKYILLYGILMFGYILINFLIGLIPVVGFLINMIIFILFMPIYFIFPFVYLDNKDLKIKEIISKTFDTVSGRRIEFYGMLCSFAGWFVLGLCTLGFLYIWILPYLYIAMTYLYLSWTHEKEFKKTKAISNGYMILILLGIMAIVGTITVVNVPSTVDTIKELVIGEKFSKSGNAELSYGGAKITFDEPKGYSLSAKTDASRTYSNDKNYNILQYSMYLSTPEKAIKLDKEAAEKMRTSGEYKKITDEEFTFKIKDKEVKGYLYKVTAKDGSKAAIAIAYYPVSSYVVTISLSDSHDGNISKDDIKQFVNIYA